MFLHKRRFYNGVTVRKINLRLRAEQQDIATLGTTGLMKKQSVPGIGSCGNGLCWAVRSRGSRWMRARRIAGGILPGGVLALPRHAMENVMVAPEVMLRRQRRSQQQTRGRDEERNAPRIGHT